MGHVGFIGFMGLKGFIRPIGFRVWASWAWASSVQGL